MEESIKPKAEHQHSLLLYSFYENGFRDLAEGLDINQFRDMLAERLKGLEDMLGDKAIGLKDSISDINIDGSLSLDEYVPIVAQRVHAFMSERFSETELEDIERDSKMENEGNRVVNELVYYTAMPGKSYLSLNLHNAVSMSLGDKLKLFKSGLEELASRLAKDDELKDIDTIKAISWIIKDHPDLVARFGFIIDSDETAHMSREDFIAKYKRG